MTKRPLAVALLLASVGVGCGHAGENARDDEPGFPAGDERVAFDDERGATAQHDGDDVMTRPPSSEAYRAVTLAELALTRGDANAAEDLLREALLHDPASPWLRVRLAQVRLQLGDVEGARESALAALRRRPKHLEARRVLALTYVLAGEKGAAERLLKETLGEQPGDRPSSTMLAELYLEQNRVGEAERVIDALMTREPNAIDGWLTLARLFADRGDVESALTYTERALERNEHSVDALEQKVTLLFAEGRFQEAVPVAERVAEERGDSARTRQLYLTALLLADAREQGEELAATWLADDRSEEMLLVIAAAFEEAGQSERARELLLRESAGAPTRRLAVTVGRLALQLGDLPTASRLLCAVTNAEGEGWFTFAQSLCVRALTLEGRAEQAKKLASAALADHPSSWRLLNALAGVAKRHPDVVAPSDVLERLARAREDAPGDRDLLDVSVRALEDLETPRAARALVDEALRESPEDPEVLMILSRHLERQGDAASAVQIAERVMSRSERPDADLLNFVAFTLADHGLRPADGERFAWQAVLRGPLNGYVLDTLGWAQHRAGKHQLARETLLRADRLSPNEPEILLHLAVVQRALGDKDAAKRALTRAKAIPYDDAHVTARIRELLRELEGSGS